MYALFVSRIVITTGMILLHSLQFQVSWLCSGKALLQSSISERNEYGNEIRGAPIISLQLGVVVAATGYSRLVEGRCSCGLPSVVYLLV